MRTFLIWLFISVSCASISQTPSLSFIGKRIVNLGDIKQGEKIYHKIEFINNGDAPLIILGISKSCNCTDVTTSSKTIKPNERASILLTIDTKGKINTNVISATITTNSKQQDYSVKVTFKVRK